MVPPAGGGSTGGWAHVVPLGGAQLGPMGKGACMHAPTPDLAPE